MKELQELAKQLQESKKTQLEMDIRQKSDGPSKNFSKKYEILSEQESDTDQESEQEKQESE